MSDTNAVSPPSISNARNGSPPSPLPAPHSFERDALEFIVFGFIIAILLCGFVVQPYFVPSASMAPVLLGLHKDVPCSRCGEVFPVGVDTDGLANVDAVQCPGCGKRDLSLEALPVSGGDQVLVWKGILQHRPVRRWDLVVFVHPQSPRECYVKRAVGLPGESIQIKHGDVHVNGEIAAKSYEQLTAMALPVGRVADLERPSPSALHVVRSARGDAFQLAATDRDGQPAAVRDLLDYNAGGDTWEREPVRDVIARMTIGDGVELRYHGLPGAPVSLRVEFGEAWLSVGGRSVRGNALPHGEGRRLTFAYWDGRIGVRWNDKPVFEEWPVSLPSADQEPASVVPLLTIRDFDRTPTDVELLRDVYYTERVGGTRGAGIDEPFNLGPKEYFMLGDNSAVSRDSRAWDDPGVSSDLFVGKPVLVHWPLFAWKIPGTNRAVQLPDFSRIRRLR
jgi:signal peptidase I